MNQEHHQVALVTGAGSGVGRAVGLAMHAAGYAVILAGRRLEELEKTAAMVSGGGMVAISTDVRRPDSIQALFAAIRKQFGRLDVLFNNAGVNAIVSTEDMAYEHWCEVMNVNLTGSFLCAQQAIRLMKEQQPRGGRIINNGSVSAHVPRPHSAAYSASKHAITGLTKSISLDGREHNIACGQIDIGNAGPGMPGMEAAFRKPDGGPVAEPRMDLKHVADAVVYMASLPLDANVQFITVMATNMPFIGRG